MKNIVLHGDTFGSILASVQVDSIGNNIVDAQIGYNYTESLPVSMLGLVDDIIGVTEAGFKSQQMNVILNVKTAEKGLQFEEQKYLGFILSSKGDSMAKINTINPLRCESPPFVGCFLNNIQHSEDKISF